MDSMTIDRDAEAEDGDSEDIKGTIRKAKAELRKLEVLLQGKTGEFRMIAFFAAVPLGICALANLFVAAAHIGWVPPIATNSVQGTIAITIFIAAGVGFLAGHMLLTIHVQMVEIRMQHAALECTLSNVLEDIAKDPGNAS